MTTILFPFIISMMIVLLLLVLRRNYDGLSPDGTSKTELLVGWCIIVYSIILGFTLNNFYNRYKEIRKTLVNEVTNLQIIYRIMKQLPNSENVIQSIKADVRADLEELRFS